VPQYRVTKTVAETAHRTTWRTVEEGANADTDSGEWHVSPRDVAAQGQQWELLYDLEIHDAAC
jgi:hypothetical protein